MDNNILNNISEEKNKKNVKFKNTELESTLMKYTKKELANNSEIISLPKNERKLKYESFSLNNMVKNMNQEELIEELMVDLSSLLVKLRNSLEDLQLEKYNFNNNKKNAIDLVRVCISVGLRVGVILEEKCTDLEEKCFVLTNYSLSYNWFTYWNDNFPKNNGISNDIQEFNEIKFNNMIFQNKSINNEEYHICTINCVKYEKFVSDFKMLSKVANNLFNQAFMMSIWNTKNDNFIEIEYFSINNIQSNLEDNIYYSENQDCNQIIPDNKLIITNFNDNYKVNRNILQNQIVNQVSIDKNVIEVEEDYDEEINDNLSNNINYILLPKMIVGSSSINDLNSNNSVLEINNGNSNGFHYSEIQFDLRNKIRRASIIMENIDIESLNECKNKVANIKHSMIKIREVQAEIYKLIIESTGEIDYLEEQSALAQINTAQGASFVAKGSKSKANWWPFHGSTAGLVCGGAAGLILGPFGVSFGAAIGGALGLTVGNMMKNHCHEKMDNIIQECEARTSKKIFRNSGQAKGNQVTEKKFKVDFIEKGNYFESIINKKTEEKYQLLLEVKDEHELNPSKFNESNSIIEEKYDKYISKATLNEILENVDIIP
ncbi:uncharacterized protein cubi_01575 [Cryptosporidium ubiquitum]|uniref:Glycine zipper domain-containing protein n=1 Tax=Cryptosporidium ubiquitum TaxID=857276 RepID=A0A1J4MDC1_9CRYT|nr:uncharacterized protein cubi_01575 [Cryptosporidium ubiquitum]OII72242.1 hypothetical protein cubi_01575 [Cryptosporidium ubiquitum]